MVSAFSSLDKKPLRVCTVRGGNSASAFYLLRGVSELMERTCPFCKVVHAPPSLEKELSAGAVKGGGPARALEAAGESAGSQRECPFRFKSEGRSIERTVLLFLTPLKKKGLLRRNLSWGASDAQRGKVCAVFDL